MKAILEFNLPEENEEFENANNGLKYLCIIEEMDEFLRRKLKYETLTEEETKCYQEIRDKLINLKCEE